MSNFIRPWDTNTESQEQEQATPKRSLFDNIGDAITAIGANFNEVRGSERLGDLRDELMNSGALSDAEYETLKNKYAQESAERQTARDTYKQAQDNLVADDSFLKNVTQMGGTLEGMAAQGIGTAVGAGLGFLSPVVGGTAMGAKVGNAAGAVAGGYLDARSVALQAEEDVLNNGGTWEQAKRAYDETLKKASLTTLPETLVDIAMGNRLVGSALNSRAARKIAGSTLGRMGSSVLDPAAKIGTQAAFKSGSTLVGRGAGILADTVLQGSTEAGQEVLQDYIENREVAKAMGQTDNEYSLGGFKDFALSDQGLETMKTAGIMGALFGGVGGTLSSGQYLTRGAETNTGIRAHNNTEKMINDGTLQIDKERRQDEEKIISALTGISPTELATWSDADIVAEASILEGQYMGVTGEAEDMATTRGAADVVRRLTSKEDNTIHREGDVTETSRAFLKGMGVDDKMLEGMFNSPVEKSLIEKARRAEEQAAKQEKTGEKQQTTARLTGDTAESMRQNEGKSAIENIKEEAQQNKAETPTVTETVTEKSTQNNLAQAAQQQEQQGKIDTSDNVVYKDSIPGNWYADPQKFEKDAMLDQQSYYNANTNKKAVITRAADGGFNVVTDLNEEREDTPHFNTLEAAENYLTGKQDDINFQESNGEQAKEGTTEDPNIVPEGGVDARVNGHSGTLINSVDDLFNFMQQNPTLLSRGEFIEFVHAKHNLGVNDLSMYIDRKNEGRVYNEQTGQWGYVNAKKFHDEATGRAMIQLYRGGDIISAVHEIAHVGYENLSNQDKATFNRYAVKSMGQWIADMLDLNYDDNFKQRLHNLQNDEELRKKIEKSPALRQTVITFLNAEQNGVDLNHLTADQIRAIDERWAWEFSLWYSEGYLRGVEPKNVVQRIYQRGVESLERELNMLQRLWEHIHHKDNQDIESLYTDRMNPSAERPNYNTEEQVAQEEEIINPFEAPPVTPQQTQQAAPVVTPVEQTVQQQAPVTPPVEQAQAPVPQEQPQVVQAQTQTKPVQEKPKNNKRQKQPEQPKEPQMTEQELNEQKWRVETGKFLKQFEGARPKQIEQSDADRLNVLINQIKEHPELDKSQGISKRISSILKKFLNQNVQPAQQEQTQEQVQEKPQTAEQTTPVAETPSEQQEVIDKYREFLKDVNGDMKAFTKKWGISLSEEEQKKYSKDDFETFLFFQDNIFNGYSNVEETPSIQQPEQPIQQGEKGTGLVPAQNLTNQNKNATVKQKQEVANSGKTEDTRGTENLRTDVGEVQRGGSVRQGNDNRTGEGRVGQNAVEGRSEGNGENLSLLKNSKFKSVYNARKEKKTEVKDWRDLSGDDKLKQVFVDALNKSKEADSQHGVYVDSKTVEELKDCKVILHKNKMAGFAITPDGNIVGVFSNPKNPIRGILNDMIFIAHMLGGNRMDCFGKFLLRGYRNCGFTPVARTSFAEEYYPADNPANATIRKEKPDVYFLVRDNDNNNTYLNKVENDVYMNDAIDADSIYHIDSEDSYSDALDFQGKVLKEIRKKSNANKSTMEIAESLRPVENQTVEENETVENVENTVVEQAPVETQEQNTSVEEQQGASEEVMEDLYNMSPVDEFDTEEDAINAIKNDNRLNNEQKKDVIDFIKDEFEQYRKIQQKKEGLKQESEIKKEKPLTTDEIYSHLYFGNKSGKLKFNKDTKKIEYFEFQNGKMVNRGEITQDQYNELRTRYEKDFKAVKGEKKSFVPDLVEGMPKDDFMYAAFKNVTGSEKEETGEGIELGKDRDVVKDKGDEYSRTNTLKNQLSNIGDVENISNLEETELTKEQKEEAKQQEKELKQEDKKKKQEEKKEQPKTTKKTTNKKKDTDPLAELHKKYKNITGTPIGEKGYRFKDDEKQFITAFKQNIDNAVGNKEELLKVSKQLDGWFQNNPTERNRMVRKYLSNYLVDAGQIKVDDGVRNQESNKVERAQDILDKAFPNTRFQYAWHGSVHDFSEFTLDHLLSGEGAMAHGWGLYFGVDLQKNKTNYFDRFSRENRVPKVYIDNKFDMDYDEFFAANLFNQDSNMFHIKSVEDLIHYIEQDIKKQEDGINEFIREYGNDKDNEVLRQFKFEKRFTEELLKRTLKNKNKIKIEQYRDPNARYYFVEIPDNKYLLREGVPFSKQSPFVQSRLVKAFSFALGLDRKDALTLLKTTDKEYYRPKRKIHNLFTEQKERHKNNLYKFLMDVVEERDANAEVGAPIYGLNLTDPDTGEILESFDSPKEMASNVLKRFGIKGISYKGNIDGECAVIFDDKAINIITKFRQEEGKWKSEKVDNARNREVDKQKAQRKLEKRREYEKKIHDEAVKNKEILDKAFPNTRFQIASHSGRVDFPEFSLAYLGTGVGDQVHGHGVYVSLTPNAAKGYFDIEKKDMELKEKLASKKPGKIMVNGVDKTESVRKLIYTYERNLGKIENENRLKIMLHSAMANADGEYEHLRKQKETIEEKGLDTYQNMAKSKSLQKQMDLVEKDADRIERMIDDIERGKIKVEYDIKYKNSPTFYEINIPDIKYMIEETATFDKQPKEIKQGIIKTVKQIYKTDNDGALKILRELPLMHEIGEQQSGKIRNPFIRQNHHPQIYWDLVNQVARSYGKKRSEAKKYVSELLNKNGVQGIHYYGQRDGECAVVFNDKAIDILNKFQKVENKWKQLNKVDNARNRQADLEKAQRKLKKHRQKDDGTRFMFGAAGANNQTILNTNKEKQFEQHFRAHMKLRGFSEKFINDYFSNNKNGEEQVIDNDKLQQKSLFNKTFIDTFNEYNNMMSRKAGVKRGLDGRWRFEFSDKNSHFDKNSLSNNFLDMVTNLPKQKGMAGKLSGKLQDVFDHKLLYKYYPQFKELKISFCTADYFKKTGLDLNVVGAYNNGEILINIDYLKRQKTIKAREVEVKQTILHEIQHAIQDYEGLAEGAGSTSFERQLRQRKLVDSYIKKLGGQKEAGQKLLNAINDVIKNIKKVPRNKRGDLYKKIRNNAEYFNDTEQNFVLKNPRAIIEGYMNNYQDVNKKYGRYFDNEVKEMCEYLSLSKDLGLNRELLRPIDQYQKLYWTHLGEIEARQTEQRMDMTDEERLKRTDVLDEGIKNLDILKDAPLVIKRTAEYSPNSNDAPLFQEANAPKNKKMTDEEREEKEYNKRKERVEKAKEEGTLSDQMKDVYSVSFTKSAQEYAENRTKMEYFDNNEDYWDRTEDKSTGKVTYVRKTPYEHQQKVVTYNGVNDVKRENKKKSKPAQWIEWMKDQLIKYMFNDKHYLAKAARKLGVYDAYRRMIVTEGYALKANTALTQGIKYNGKTTRALNDIIRDVGEPKQKAFLKYCIAHRILDLKDRENPVFQKMKPDEARRYIEEIKASPDAELFERNRKDFVEYNKALLHVLVDGGIMDEKTFQKFCEVDPNFVPLTKVMDDADMGFSSIINAHNLVNLKSPIKKIGTSMLEVANPFLEMQKRTAEYYAIASRNKAGQIFVNEIAGALEKTTEGDVIARGQGMLRRVRVDERNGQLITKPDDKQQIIYVCNNGKHEFYQVADKEIYQALTFMNADQMGTIHKMLDNIAHVPSGLVRETATMVPDFGVRNVIRDGGEAFLTSEHGFLPVIDQIWGMWQVMNNTEWAQMYFNQNGEYGTLNRDRVNSEGIASVDDVIDEKLNPLKNFKEIKQAQMAILKDKQRQFSILTDIKDGNFGDAWEHTRKSRGMAALKLAISPLWAIGKSNKRMNDLFELGTRVGEFKNAKMGFEGTLDRIARGIMNTNLKEAELQKKAQSDVYAAHVAKDITLNFSQHGKLGKELNRYIPFFNASLQGIYKLCNTLEAMVTGTTISGGKNRRLQQELLFKAALITAMAVGVAAAGDGDEDYEEAPDYEKENFWILPNGLRFPKDQVLGKIIGNTVEKSYAQWKKGKAEPSTILKSILENFKPDRFMFAIFDLAIGGFGNYDTFKERSIVPEYMADKLGHLQKDISTSNFAVDVSEALWKCGFDISAKKIDWALQKNFSNCAKYATAIYDLGKKTFNPKEFNERIARGYDKNDSTGSMVAGLKDDIPSPINLVSGTFATNRSTFKSISDFYENYKKYKKLSSDEASMSKEDKRMWKRYEQAYKKDMTFRKQLRAIKQDRTLTGKQKREKADKIFKQQIKLAKWAEG